MCFDWDSVVGRSEVGAFTELKLWCSDESRGEFVQLLILLIA